MFNLLPDSLKNEIKSVYNIRRLVLILLFILFIQISSFVFIYPSWLTASYKEEDALVQTEKMNQSALALNASSTTNTIKSINQRLSIVNTALNYPKFIPIINAVIDNKSKSVSLTRFSYSLVSSSTASITLEGVSATRESLVSFKKRLEESGSFKAVDLPISNLAKDKNINFTINMTATP